MVFTFSYKFISDILYNINKNVHYVFLSIVILAINNISLDFSLDMAFEVNI